MEHSDALFEVTMYRSTMSDVLRDPLLSTTRHPMHMLTARSGDAVGSNSYPVRLVHHYGRSRS